MMRVALSLVVILEITRLPCGCDIVANVQEWA